MLTNGCEVFYYRIAIDPECGPFFSRKILFAKLIEDDEQFELGYYAGQQVDSWKPVFSPICDIPPEGVIDEDMTGSGYYMLTTDANETENYLTLQEHVINRTKKAIKEANDGVAMSKLVYAQLFSEEFK